MSAPIDHWPDRLETVLAERCTTLKRVFVMRQTDSTQDAARRLRCGPGDVVVAWRQTAGRGRLGRNWADTSEDGIAMTIVLRRDQQFPQRLAIAAAVGAAQAAELLLNQPVQIKWPNDILVNGRKLAGILIEQFDSLSLIGIGLNVSQTTWPNDLAAKAVSLAQLNCQVDRLEALAAMLPAIDAALQMDDAALTAEFSRRDALRGQTISFRCGDRALSGVVLHVDPMRGLAVRTHVGEVWLDAATTTIEQSH